MSGHDLALVHECVAVNGVGLSLIGGLWPLHGRSRLEHLVPVGSCLVLLILILFGLILWLSSAASVLIVSLLSLLLLVVTLSGTTSILLLVIVSAALVVSLTSSTLQAGLVVVGLGTFVVHMSFYHVDLKC